MEWEETHKKPGQSSKPKERLRSYPPAGKEAAAGKSYEDAGGKLEKGKDAYLVALGRKKKKDKKEPTKGEKATLMVKSAWKEKRT